MALAPERTLEQTSTWAVAVVCFVLLAVSILIEHGIQLLGKWLTKKNKRALYDALEKIKSELMLLGFLSFLLTVLKDPISGICISKSVAATWHPCSKEKEAEKYSKAIKGRKAVEFSDPDDFSYRRRLAAKGYDTCTSDPGKVAFMSAYGIHQLHIFIFVLAVFHVLYCILTLGLGRYKMREWKVWEKETRTVEYQYYNDPERFRFARDTSFGQRHLNFWSRSTISLWIVSFFRQLFRSVSKVDYLTLRHGFIMAHLAPESEATFDFRKYISRSLEEDFKVIVGISPVIWLCAVLLLLSNAYDWHSYLWLPFIPLIIVLLVGTKLQVIITRMGMRIQDRGGVVKGAPLVQPGDHLFWFGSPHFMLLLIHFVLFQNAFQLAFFAWSAYTFKLNSCFHERTEDIVIRLSMGIFVQVFCSYVTLPLYALVTQMGSHMKPTVFNEEVAAALKKWHHTAKENTKHGHHTESNTPFASRPGTPTHGMSPVHLLHKHTERSDVDRFYEAPSPRQTNLELGNWGIEGSSHSPNNDLGPRDTQEIRQITNNRGLDRESSSAQMPTSPRPIGSEHDVKINISQFSFDRGQ